MKKSFSGLTKELRLFCNKFDKEAEVVKNKLLTELSKKELPLGASLIEYVDVLMFVTAHPANDSQLSFAEKELRRVAVHLKRTPIIRKSSLCNSGLPFCETSTQFSHDFSCWLSQQKDIRLNIQSFDDGSTPLIEILKLTLPSVEREYTTTGSSNEELMDALMVSKTGRFEFILKELSAFNSAPLVKDHLFDSLSLVESIQPISERFSRPFNRLKNPRVFYHSEILKNFDHNELLNIQLPHACDLSEFEKRDCVDVIKRSMALMARETDPATFMDSNSLKLFELERGISVAIFGMTPERQLQGESYVGFTLFKNGFPASYGGAWVFGRRALFGINIFEAFRGGESGYFMCQILRVYRQAFGVDYFEVEPYQYGADNPDGITSGAFWFYYRFGFRPLDKNLAKLAEIEMQRITEKRGYRSSEKTLLRFTESNIAMNLGNNIPPTISELVVKMTQLISKKYGGDRALAEGAVVQAFLKNTRFEQPLTTHENRVLIEVAFLAAVLPIEKIQYDILKQMIYAKPKDILKYQRLLITFFQKGN